MEQQYSSTTALAYTFNLIVGTGALAIPGAVAQCGYVLSTLVLLFLAFISFITVTFMIEAMAITNFITRNELNVNTETSSEAENDPLVTNEVTEEESFEISKTFEMGTMATIYFPKLKLIFYIILITYLYGDLSIYITAVAKSLTDVTCHKSCPQSTFIEIDANLVQQFYTILFLLTIAPLGYFKIGKTKYLQVATTFLRWSAFFAMVTLSIIKILNEPPLAPRISNPIALPKLLGVTIYSFMCHHSVPSLITPIRNKKNLTKYFFVDYFFINLFYVFLSVTAVFAFPNVRELYTLNFLGNSFINYFLSLFPVFTLSTNFPIITITLKNNLKSLFGNFENNFLFTFLAVFPPFLVSFFVGDVAWIINFTGSFAGVGIQYLVPGVLLLGARSRGQFDNPHRSWFRSNWWIYFVLVWGLLTMGLVGVDLFWL